ncbi:tripeptide aminopeptidase [Tumebacillus sp. BK434]|uniref:M20/M25/M40 family metallo-hydrolase n=1 Tax=Tumebacillus sp. BK434 TaxID=2512169 RepID=UPI0010473153|nr:M20/M25/M40 family metallo-hydrolase [Tumebacillus sp. BK434]TCP59588.1 tripeptide aminopeptidase [Tumebacillus sp. BK434]
MIQVNRERLIQEFMELVQIDSLSRDERNMADAVTAKLKEQGVEVVEDNAGERIDGNAGNLICTIKGDPSKKTILFTCHLDTVAPGKGIKPQLLEDRITSDGTTILGADDKAGIAGILEMVRALKEQNLSHGNIVLFLTVSEETGLLGSRHADWSKLPHVDMGFAFDSNGPIGKVVTKSPSQARLDIVINGRLAHAGVNPEAGISAIKVASAAISRMKLGRINENTTANIGSFHGGEATNVVCDRVEIKAEARSLDPAELDVQIAHMKETFEATAADFNTTAEVTVNKLYHNLRHEESAEVVQTAFKAIRMLDIEPSTMSSGGGSDANVLNGRNIPTVNLAIGYQKIHTVEEFIMLDDLETAAKLFIAVTQAV